MTLEVIGASFGRTGTMSLKVALEELGFGPCYHMREVFEHPDCPPPVDSPVSEPQVLCLARKTLQWGFAMV